MFSWLNIGPKSFSNRYRFCERIGRFSSLWSCFGLWSACKTTRIQFQCIFFKLHFWDFLFVVVPLFVVQVCVQLIQAMRNSDPRVRMVLIHRLVSDFHSIFNLVGNWLQLLIHAQFWCSLGSILLVQIILHLLAVCTHDKPLHGIVRILPRLSSWNTVRLQLWSGILHQYKIYFICLAVITFPFVLNIVAIEDLCEQGHHNPKALLSWSRLARMRNSIALR